MDSLKGDVSQWMWFLHVQLVEFLIKYRYSKLSRLPFLAICERIPNGNMVLFTLKHEKYEGVN